MQNPFTAARLQAMPDRIRVNTRRQLVEVTRQRTAEIQSELARLTGGPAAIRRFVDGSPSKPLERAELFTLTQFDLFDRIVDEVIETLVRNSPYGPEEGGHYRDDHWLFVNGRRRDAATGGAPVRIKQGDVVMIVNARPYATKLERGARRRGSNRRRPGLSVQAPNGIYEVSAQELRRRFGQLVRIRHVFRQVSGVPSRGKGYPALEIAVLAA